MISSEMFYKEDDVVSYYTNTTTLRKPEETILGVLKKNLPSMRMLDLGVGAGRTTSFFAPLVKEYVGIDYSEKMVAACTARFQGSPGRIRFALCDARNMGIFEDDYFDFLLFSLNGLDYVSHADRLQTLKEIHRVGQAGGYFCFSSHNLQWVPAFLDLRRQFTGGVKATIQNLKRWALLRFIYNSGAMVRRARCASYAVLKDGVHEYRLQHYFIRPAKQLEQLAEWFCDVEVYSATSGSRIEDLAKLDNVDDPWLYYLCRIK